jgi:hypothetical protein
MKKITLLLMLVAGSTGYTQSIEKETVTFSSERLPLMPIAGLEGYNFTVETPYKENNDAVIEDARAKYDAEVANYPNTVAEAEIAYERALVEYEEDVVKARENYKLQSEEYDKLSAVEKIALKAQAPVLRLPSKPNYYKPAEPVYREPNTSNIITFDPEVLASSYLKLAGYNKVEGGNVLMGTVILQDIQAESPISRYDEKMVYNSSTKTRVPQRTYYFITKYNRPTYVKLQLGNEILFEGVLESSLVQDSIRTTTRPNMMNVERESVREALALANDFINTNYGYSQVERTYDVEYVKNKKGEYDDLELAKDLALASYKNFDGGKNVESLNKAIAIWLKAIEESDLESKKARINKKVTIPLLMNLINAYLVTENPAMAQKYFTALKDIKVPYRVEIMLDGIESEIIDLQNRVNAKI